MISELSHIVRALHTHKEFRVIVAGWDLIDLTKVIGNALKHFDVALEGECSFEHPNLTQKLALKSLKLFVLALL